VLGQAFVAIFFGRFPKKGFPRQSLACAYKKN